MTRFMVYNRNYDEDYSRLTSDRRVFLGDLFPEDEKWVVESVDSGHESYYATHEDAINSIYEGSK